LLTGEYSTGSAIRIFRRRPEEAFQGSELIRGMFERGEVSRIAGLPERTVRRVLDDRIATGLFAADTPKGPGYYCDPIPL
jgi:hypothetical protein